GGWLRCSRPTGRPPPTSRRWPRGRPNGSRGPRRRRSARTSPSGPRRRACSSTSTSKRSSRRNGDPGRVPKPPREGLGRAELDLAHAINGGGLAGIDGCWLGGVDGCWLGGVDGCWLGGVDGCWLGGGDLQLRGGRQDPRGAGEQAALLGAGGLRGAVGAPGRQAALLVSGPGQRQGGQGADRARVQA